MHSVRNLAILLFALSGTEANAATTPATTSRTTAQTVPAANVSSSPLQAEVRRRSNLYFGTQLGDSILGALMGIAISDTYTLEVRYDYKDPVYQPTGKEEGSSLGIAAVALFPVKLDKPEPLFVFAKAGYERTKDKSTTYDPGIPGLPTFPASTTATTIVRHRAIIGGGTQYDFSNHLSLSLIHI